MNIKEIKGLTIFAVDDNKENLKVLVQYLSDFELIVVPLRTGEETLNLVKKRIPDMILLDIMMPGGIDGYETCRRLKTNKATKDIPVIFMSALTDTFDKVTGLNLGAVDYITKPIETEELLSRIHTHLSISRLQKKLFELNVQLEEKILARTEEVRKTNIQLRKEIEERKQTETELKQSEERYALAQKVGNIGSWDWNILTGDLYWSEQIEPMFGYKKGEFGATYEAFLECVHSEDRQNVIDSVNACIEKRKDYDIEHRIVWPDGSIRWVSETGNVFTDKKDKIIRMLGIVQDITERKQTVESLRQSEKKYRELQDNVPVGVFRSTPQGKFVSVNPTMAKMLGYNSSDELMKTDIINIYADNKDRKEILDKADNDGVVQDYEGKAKRKDGSTFWVSISLRMICDTDKNTKYYDGIIVDITERKLADEELKKLNQAIEQSPVCVVITDTEGNIEYVNQHFSELTGYSAKEAIGQNPRILNAGTQPKEYYKEMWETLTAGKKWIGELHNKTAKGDLYWENAIISPVKNETGQITHFIAVKENVTDKKKLWDDLVAAKEKAEESDRLKSAFLTNMSHEIRTPMNGILGFSNLLKEPGLTGDEQQEYINLIEMSGTRMLDTINNLMDISKIEAGQVEVSVSEVNINEQIEYLYSIFKPEAKIKGLQLFFSNTLPERDVNIIILLPTRKKSILS